MDVDGVTTPPPRRALDGPKVRSPPLARRIAFGALALGIPMMAFALLMAVQPGPSGDGGPGGAAAEGGGDGLPDAPLGGGTLPARDFGGDGVPGAAAPDPGNVTDDPGLPGMG